jgi:6-pyruvoyltetrahydropterin/6-carboxytetrahydropterin synthase
MAERSETRTENRAKNVAGTTRYEIRIRKEAHKFAASHMTVFPDGSKEALHGHQYLPTVKIAVQEVDLKNMIPFSDVKVAMKKIAKFWDEKVLLATENPYFKISKKSKTEVDFVLCKKRYVIPADEIVFLDTDNITCENLSKVYFDLLERELGLTRNQNILSISVDIEESPGQGVAYVYERG